MNKLIQKKFKLYLSALLLVIFVFYSSARAIDRFSFQFDHCSLKEALSEISSSCDIKINAPYKELAGIQINKSFTNSDLSKILQDIFRGQNYAIEWRYENNTLTQINIRMADTGESSHKEAQRFPASITKNNGDNGPNDVSWFGMNQQQSMQTSSVKPIKKVDETIPPAPDPAKFNGLEPPPMPPGIPEIPVQKN